MQKKSLVPFDGKKAKHCAARTGARRATGVSTACAAECGESLGGNNSKMKKMSLVPFDGKRAELPNSKWDGRNSSN